MDQYAVAHVSSLEVKDDDVAYRDAWNKYIFKQSIKKYKLVT